MINLAEDVNMIAGEQHAQPTQELRGGRVLAQLNNDEAQANNDVNAHPEQA
jgi:hypothetical protein